jgi:hypothetical protein
LIAELFISLLAILGFAVVLRKTAIGQVAHSLVAAVLSGVRALFDSELGDHQKEVALRRAALALMGKIWHLSWRFILSLLAAAFPIVAADLVGLARSEDTLGLMLRLDYIVVVSVVAAIVAHLVVRRHRKTPEAGSSDSVYGVADRFVHTLAFSTPGVMKTLAAVDDRVFAAAIGDVHQEPPIFITSLPRGGTTAVLNAFHDMPAIATHEYCDMPFITAPFLWSKLGGKRSGRVARHQRAHGDGLEIDLNSPEAFDEVLWRLFWSEKYRADAIDLWQEGDRKPWAAELLRSHFAKIISLRSRGVADPKRVRYLSKNNANIARIRVLHDFFPGCDIVIPIRRPATHAASLLRQHRNFLRLQFKDDFVRRFMLDIGHLEFGNLHRPIAFDGFDPDRRNPEQADYWLSYWIAAFREVKAQGAGCRIITQDDLRSRPQDTLTALCDELGLPNTAANFSKYFRTERDAELLDDLFSNEMLVTANTLYDELCSRAVR